MQNLRPQNENLHFNRLSRLCPLERWGNRRREGKWLLWYPTASEVAEIWWSLGQSPCSELLRFRKVLSTSPVQGWKDSRHHPQTPNPLVELFHKNRARQEDERNSGICNRLAWPFQTHLHFCLQWPGSYLNLKQIQPAQALGTHRKRVGPERIWPQAHTPLVALATHQMRAGI